MLSGEHAGVPLRLRGAASRRTEASGWAAPAWGTHTEAARGTIGRGHLHLPVAPPACHWDPCLEAAEQLGRVRLKCQLASAFEASARRAGGAAWFSCSTRSVDGSRACTDIWRLVHAWRSLRRRRRRFTRGECVHPSGRTTRRRSAEPTTTCARVARWVIVCARPRAFPSLFPPLSSCESCCLFRPASPVAARHVGGGPARLPSGRAAAG